MGGIICYHVRAIWIANWKWVTVLSPLAFRSITVLFNILLADLLSSSPDIETRRLQTAIAQLVLLRMDYTELDCLKTIVLFRPGTFYLILPDDLSDIIMDFAFHKLDCPALTSPHQISMLQDETIKIMLDKCGGSRMAHILLTIPFIRLAGDGKVLQVWSKSPFTIQLDRN